MTLLLEKQSEPEFVQIHRVADSLTPDLRKRFLAALETLKRQIPLDTLADLIDKGNVGGIGELIAGLDVEVRSLIETVSRKAIKGVGEVTAAGFGLDFALDNPAVVRWVEGNAGKLITGITSETQKAVVGIVRNGFVEGVPPKAMARQIRRVVGLTARDAGAVDRFWRKIVEDRDDVVFADRQANRMRDRLLRARAETIARTETITSASRGQLEAWNQAADEGLLNPERTKRIWVATEDDRLCPRCALLDGETVAFNEPFILREQATGFEIVPAGVVAGTPQKDIKVTGTKPLKEPIVTMTPALHPRCRCGTALVFV